MNCRVQNSRQCEFATDPFSLLCNFGNHRSGGLTRTLRVHDPRFQPYVLGNAAIERIAGGCRFTEGPVWFGGGRYLLWSDIPNDRILKWEEETGVISVYRRPSNYANGNTRDRQGRLITCEM